MKKIIPTLTKQVMSPVYFEDCIKTMIAEGVDTFIEIGPGKTLSSFIKRAIKPLIFNIVKTKNI